MTDDDQCGWPTEDGDGPPCENPPTGEDGHCWLHPPEDADADVGRGFALDKDDHDDVLQAAREGLSKRGCARAAGVSHTALERYLDAHAEFRASFMRARQQGERQLITDGLYDEDTDSSMAKFLLASSFDYKKTEKREIEADVDASHDVTADFVTFGGDDVDE